ncbi:transglutaminase-like domain-containing protein [Zavarzinella formosa]|uniref:transglutaminase-like domain-containing protein n=1 Tax=Zavarzinella formosa TaxID=360055 RepID=UPI0012F8B3DF|nr:transglutaminase-like domain-containing protein [Zavarzinella formosa]
MFIQRHVLPGLLALCGPMLAVAAEPVKPWWPAAVEKRLVSAGENRAQLEKALNGIPNDQRKGMQFLIENMPDADLAAIKGDFLILNHELAYKARQETPWGKDIPEDVFFNNVLAYANVDEKRDPWRKEFYDMCMPMVKSCKTPSEAVMKLNSELFKTLKLKYAPQRRSPNLSPKESIAQGTASCTGLSIVLSDACRAVCIPARLAGTPNWFDNRGNHTWVEIWDKDWHFTGACEPDPKGLDRGWFVGDAAKADKDSPEHSIYAASFRKTDSHYPLVWARTNKGIPGENVTDRYAKSRPATTETVRVSIRVIDQGKKRIATAVAVTAAGETKPAFEGTSRGENADLNDLLHFDLAPEKEYVVKIGQTSQPIKTGKAGTQQLVEILKTDK